MTIKVKSYLGLSNEITKAKKNGYTVKEETPGKRYFLTKDGAASIEILKEGENMNEIKKELLQKEPQALKALNKILNMDFCKKVDFLKIEGRYTARQIENAAAAAGHNPYNSIIAILTTGVKYREEYIYISTLGTLGSVKTNYKTDYSYIVRHDYTTRSRCNIESYYNKGDFDKYRKEENITTYIVCQARENLTQENPHSVDYNNRFKVLSVQKWTRSGGGASFIGRIDLERTDDNGSRACYNDPGRVIYSNKDYPTDILQVIDKSGYIIDSKRDELKRRANGLRAERAKAAYTATDNAAKLEELKKEIDAKKAAIIEELTNATTGAQVNSIGHKIYFYDGLGGIMSDFERLSARDASKDFSSISDFDYYYNRIREHLANI